MNVQWTIEMTRMEGEKRMWEGEEKKKEEEENNAHEEERREEVMQRFLLYKYLDIVTWASGDV